MPFPHLGIKIRTYSVQVAPQQASATVLDAYVPSSIPASTSDAAADVSLPHMPYTPEPVAFSMQVRQPSCHIRHARSPSSGGVFDTCDGVNEQASEALGSEGSQAAVSGRGGTGESALEERLRDAAAKSLAAKQRRRSLLADVATCTSASRPLQLLDLELQFVK